MASNEITVKIRIADIKPLEDLMEVLCRHLDELPPELRQAVQAVVDYEGEESK